MGKTEETTNSWDQWQKSMQESWAEAMKPPAAPPQPSPQELAKQAKEALDSFEATAKQMFDMQVENARVWSESFATRPDTSPENAKAVRDFRQTTDAYIQTQRECLAIWLEAARKAAESAGQTPAEAPPAAAAPAKKKK